MSNSKWRLYSDGGSRGNPGPAASAFVLLNPAGNLQEKCGKYLGKTTNNQAEYSGLLEGLRAAIRQQVTELDCFLDSELVVKQMVGEYRIKDPALRQIATFEIGPLRQKFTSLTFNHIPREKNKEADLLVNETLDRVL